MNKLFIYCDGGSRGNPGLAASAFVAYDQNQKLIFKNGFFLGKATNNFAEYTAVLKSVNWLIENKFSNTDVEYFLDSQLVVNQLNGQYKIKESTLIDLARKIKSLQSCLDNKIIFNYIPREKNTEADLLVNKTLDEYTT